MFQEKMKTKTKEAIVVSELDHFQLETMKMVMDGSDHWKDLLVVLHSIKCLPDTTIQDIQLRSSGINPVKNYLEYLKVTNPGYTVIEFESLATELDRQDIVTFIEKNQLSGKLSSITLQHQNTLIKLLNKSETDLYTWVSFASKCNIPFDKIECLRAMPTSIGSKSPTKEIFLELRMCQPSLAINTLMMRCNESGKSHVAAILEQLGN